jgi:hypothetical protein
MYPKWGAYQPNFGVSDLTYREGFNNASHPRAAYSMQPSEFHHAGLSGKYSGCLWCLCALIIYIYIIYLFIEREMFFLNVYSFIYFIYSIYIYTLYMHIIYLWGSWMFSPRLASEQGAWLHHHHTTRYVKEVIRMFQVWASQSVYKHTRFVEFEHVKKACHSRESVHTLLR